MHIAGYPERSVISTIRDRACLVEKKKNNLTLGRSEAIITASIALGLYLLREICVIRRIIKTAILFMG